MSEQNPTPGEIAEVLTDAGLTITEGGILPDGSGFMIGSMPLRPDHWIYETDKHDTAGNPPMLARLGIDDPRREQWEKAVQEAGRYAVKCVTFCGKEDDFDPDALVRNIITGLLGYNTSDGLSHMDDGMWNPDPLPPSIFDAETNRKVLYYEALHQAGRRYKEMIQSVNPKKMSSWQWGKLRDLEDFINHFLEKVLEEYPLEKLNRWLGNIQGKLHMLGITDDETERTWTRQYFRPLDFPKVLASYVTKVSAGSSTQEIALTATDSGGVPADSIQLKADPIKLGKKD